MPVKEGGCGLMAQVLRDPDITLTSQVCDSGGKCPKASVSRDTPLEAQLCIPGLPGAGGDKCTDSSRENPSHWQVAVSMNSAGNFMSLASAGTARPNAHPHDAQMRRPI